MKPIFIAEVKISSPFGFKSDKSWETLFDIANEFGDWISIHTDFRWGGDMELITRARKLTTKPILAKGIHQDEKLINECFGRGANYCLTVGFNPIYNKNYNKIWIEPESIEQYHEFRTFSSNFVWNSRDLSTGKVKKETIYDIRPIHGEKIIQASNIKTIKDVKSDCYGFIVGENLIDFCKDKNNL